MHFLDKYLGDQNEKILKRMRKRVIEVNALEEKFSAMSDEDLRMMTDELKDRLGDDRGVCDPKELEKRLDGILVEAFAVVREAAKRTLGQRHFDVQLIGAQVLHERGIAEMKTGEGKTLTSTAAVYVNALAGRGVHVVTVNDYLARRDTAWMGQVYHFLGLSLGCIQNQGVAYVYDSTVKADEEDSQEEEMKSFKVDMDNLRPVSRREVYQTDITYGTNNEFGFDYLRDNMVYSADQRVQRPLHYAIIDEVDSILIDEARTPLIISAPDAESTDRYQQFAQLVRQLEEGNDYTVDEKMNAVSLTQVGIEKAEKRLGVANIYTEDVTLAFHLDQALKAQALFHKDQDYVVKDGEVLIVDEFTGRLMPGRRYSQGLHQAIEAKEGVEVQKENRTLATITIQNYFRMYKKLSGMTGTAATEAEEFQKIYDLEVVQIPTNKKVVRIDRADVVYKNETGKFQALVKEVKQRHQKGQPVLIGTISIEKNELLSELLEKAGVSHNLLNAKNHEREAEIIAQAGRIGAVTVATNMAGRGVDIVLGGHPYNKEEAQKVKDAGGLLVLGSERHEARRIDNQLRGRSGRQGDQGESQFFISMEDELMRIFGSDRIKRMMDAMGIPDDMPIENNMVSRAMESAQKKVEGHHFDTRKHLLQYDDILNHQRRAVYRMRNEILELAKDDQQERTLRAVIMEMVSEELRGIVAIHTASPHASDWQGEEIMKTIETLFPLDDTVKNEISMILRDQQGDEARSAVVDFLITQAEQTYVAVEELFDDKEALRETEKSILLRTIDTHWMDHLDAVEHVRAGIGLRGYGQRDPLVEYKRETHRLYEELLALIHSQVALSIFKISRDVDHAMKVSPLFQQFRNIQLSAPAKTAETKKSAISMEGESDATSQAEIVEESLYPKVGRNDPCPCGSKHSDERPIKYKHCHGK
ncbi:MAG TPA: preprotein translocase subunit SecA [Candidatus Jacksonbacteria bacterium]|uniref:Protein translocase subunit SecA n=1 Tax=Candidatus Falkowbacteria bacterium GW2011_GWA2_41_14 TaxID=1618635 RepID=A0A0G0UVR0_9BACT|nr:MAG: Protein translocase subunit SecA [Candidatus Falkowbacteria bacterium GW2011_GWA2_41_14]OGY68947.1 MAG: preprotein translocase subunit SecA [Candidatus Jacksonbacteria bacterium RIFCSPHIGHO2_02_FULL_43_10]OGY70953.1 MAG: preprotein translocase subunit SecA [Candidatus Jacksonbacteria bacterium RIFCSPLOWO2_01_FULL_44_13]HAZ16472.1 preprotein translocase subunit SecA [Candidatus Jacksonbacteria bacterium]